MKQIEGMEDPVVRVIVRVPSRKGVDSPHGNLCAFETRQVPSRGDEFGFDNKIFEVRTRCWCPRGDQGERPWVVYLEVEEAK